MVVGTSLDAVVVEINIERRYIAISVKRLTKSTAELFFDEHLEQTVDVRIDSIGPIGATVSFPGTAISGRLHIKDIVWGYCERMTDYFREGDIKTVRCLAYDQWEDVITVGIKQLEQNDFKTFQSGYTVGTTVACRVDAVTGQSIRVRVLFDGRQTFGYVHRAEVSWLLFVDDRTARHIFRDGETYDCSVKRFDEANELVEFSRKQFLAGQREKNAYGVPYRARVVFSNRDAFAYGNFLEGRLVDCIDERRSRATSVEVMISRKGAAPRDVELTLG